ncbi:MAG TPA: hypothetical protein VE081_00625 [Sporichthyaceae bacterium]|nr:hypothetical protein [Sporichthyaceae bacterium]
MKTSARVGLLTVLLVGLAVGGVTAVAAEAEDDADEDRWLPDVA